MSSHEPTHAVVVWQIDKDVLIDLIHLPREEALAQILRLTNDPFWDHVHKLTGTDHPDIDHIACVRGLPGELIYAVPLEKLNAFIKERGARYV